MTPSSATKSAKPTLIDLDAEMQTGRKQELWSKTLKTCSSCKIDKPLSEFYVSKKAKDGRQHRCTDCSKSLTQAATASWRELNPERVKEPTRRTKLQRKYSLSYGELYVMWELQNKLCAICRKSIDFDAADKRDIPHVDHNHDTGQVRGLLCLTCNTGLGMLGDSLEMLDAARVYLQHGTITAISGQRERLSELAPERDDATVCSLKNKN